MSLIKGILFISSFKGQHGCQEHVNIQVSVRREESHKANVIETYQVSLFQAKFVFFIKGFKHVPVAPPCCKAANLGTQFKYLSTSLLLQFKKITGPTL